MSEEGSGERSRLASFIASKVYYNLEEYEESLKYALESGEHFDYNKQDKYTETLINNCINLFT